MDLTRSQPVSAIKSRRGRRRSVESIFWYVVLCLVAVITVFPFIWVISTSIKGPEDVIYSVPPQLIPKFPTLENYRRVWEHFGITADGLLAAIL